MPRVLTVHVIAVLLTHPVVLEASMEGFLLCLPSQGFVVLLPRCTNIQTSVEEALQVDATALAQPISVVRWWCVRDG